MLILIDLELSGLGQALFAIRYATEVTMAILQVSRLFPFGAACVAAIMRVMVIVRVNSLCNKKDRLRLVEDVFTVTDHETSRSFKHFLYFVAVIQSIDRLTTHTDALGERLVECTFVTDELGEALDLAR